MKTQLGYYILDVIVIKNGNRYKCMPIQDSKSEWGYQKWKCGKCLRGNIDTHFYLYHFPFQCKVCGAEIDSVDYKDYPTESSILSRRRFQY